MANDQTWFTVNLFRHDDIPQKPGVYVFIKKGRVVYVGQSGNLYNRFWCYCAARPPVNYDVTGRSPRLPVELEGVVVKVSLSRRFGDWLMREARLIRRLQPERNSAGLRRRLAAIS